MLDRKRSFGEVFGAPDHRYVQDGRKFDHEGVELPGQESAKPAEEPKHKKPKVKPDDQLGAQLQE